MINTIIDRTKLHSAWGGFPFEILGHFEELIDTDTNLCIATRPVEYLIGPNDKRKGLKVPPIYGYYGGWKHTFKKGEIITIDKAHKGLQKFKFQRKTECVITTQPVCGRMIPREIWNPKS